MALERERRWPGTEAFSSWPSSMARNRSFHPGTANPSHTVTAVDPQQRQLLRAEQFEERAAELIRALPQSQEEEEERSRIRTISSQFNLVSLTARRSSEDSCSICLEPMHGECSAMPCGHAFHTACITSWLPMRPSCPICRSKEFVRADDPPLVRADPTVYDPRNPTEHRRRMRNWTSITNSFNESLRDLIRSDRVGADPTDYDPLEHIRYPRSRPARSVPASQSRAVLASPTSPPPLRELRRSHRRVLIGGNSAVR